MKVAFLEYTFIFDPADTWTSLWDFETDFARYLGDHGLEAEIIKTVEGQGGKRLLFITKKQDLIKITPNQPGRPMSAKGIIKMMTNRKPRAAERDFGNRKLKTSKIFNKVK